MMKTIKVTLALNIICTICMSWLTISEGPSWLSTLFAYVAGMTLASAAYLCAYSASRTIADINEGLIVGQHRRFVVIEGELSEEPTTH